MHNIFLIRRRFPDKGNAIIVTLALLSFCGLLAGIGLLLLF